jgi:hypothetical protein
VSKHTPGPWASNEYTTSVSVPLKAVDCERIGFSIVFVNGHRGKEAAANARLIAAAPELLEALKMFVVWYGRRDKHDTLLPPKMQEAELAQAMRAIAKVEGTTE